MKNPSFKEVNQSAPVKDLKLESRFSDSNTYTSPPCNAYLQKDDPEDTAGLVICVDAQSAESGFSTLKNS